MIDKNLIIYFGKRSIFSRFLSALFYAITIFLVYNYFFLNRNFIRINEIVEMRSGMFSILFVLSLALRFSINVSFHFNFQKLQYRRYYYIGPLGFGRWTQFRKLDRVSTFLNSRKECEVNIWDIKNNRYRIAIFEETDAAVEYGRELAKTLQIKFKERN